NLHAHQGRLRLDLSALDHEPATPGADLDLDPCAGHQTPDVDPISVGQARRVLVESADTQRGCSHSVLRIRPFLAPVPIALAVALVAARAISEVCSKVGHSAAPLDDAYIHFQYARAIAEGHPLRFQAGEPISSGATSLLWPAILAPF